MTATLTVKSVRVGRRGTATIRCTATGAGVVNLLATARVGRKRIVVGRVRRTVSAPGAFTLKLTPSRAAKAALRARPKLRTTLRISFTPTGGRTAVQNRTVTLKR